MKKSLLVISTVLTFGVAVMGCATKGDLDRMQAREQQLNLKTDQALKASQEANETAKRASQAVEAAEERARIAEEKARIAEEKAEKAEATFKGSMRK
jgi:murein lipoprotein